MKKRTNIAICMLLTSIFALGSFTSCDKNSKDSAGGNEPPAEVIETKLPVATTANGEEIMLAKNGVSEYTIVIPDEPDLYESFAATELQMFIEASTGAQLPIFAESEIDATQKKFLYIGEATHMTDKVSTDEYGDNGAYIDFDDGNVYMVGSTDIGDLNAVYEFLRYQISWEIYAEDEIYFEINPTLPLLAFDELKYTMTIPYLNMRMSGLFGAQYKYANARMGALEGVYSGGNSFYSKIWATWLHSLEKIVTSEAEREGINRVHGEEIQAAIDERLPKMIADRTDDYIWEYEIEPTEAIIAEWTAEISVQIRSDVIFENSWQWWSNDQMCLSKTEVSDFCAEAVKKILLENPEAKFVLLGGMDNLRACECAYCEEALIRCKTQGGIALDFMNRISEKLEKDRFFEENPQVNENVVLSYMHYHAYVTAPVETDANGNITKTYVTARDNVGVYLCPIGACMSHAFDDPECPLNVNQYENLKSWGSVTDYIQIYVYWANYRNYLTYVDAWGAFQTWSELFGELGVNYVYVHGGGNNEVGPFGALQTYLAVKYFVNSDAGEFDTLVQDFMQHYYKDAADVMYAFYTEMRTHTMTMQYLAGDSCFMTYDDNSIVQYTNKKWWSFDYLNSLLEYMDEAYAAIDASLLSQEVKDKLRDRIQIEEMTLRYWRKSYWSTYLTEAQLIEEENFIREVATRLGVKQLIEGVIENW